MTYLRLLQHLSADNVRSVILAEGDAAHVLTGVTTVRELALRAIVQGRAIASISRPSSPPAACWRRSTTKTPRICC
jgi:hypothetical protein